MPESKSKSKVAIFSNFDQRIYSVFFITILLATALLFIQKKDYVNCQASEFKVEGEKFSNEEVITFSNTTHNAKKWEWDFGDGSPKEYRDKVLHQFKEPGVYEVNLIINNSCVLSQKVEITFQQPMVNIAEVPRIIMPEFTRVDEPVTFAFDYPGDVQTVEWSFGESGKVDKTEQNPEYTYKSEGEKTVAVIINGNVVGMGTAKIFVNPKAKAGEEPLRIPATVRPIVIPPQAVQPPPPPPKPVTDRPTLTANPVAVRSTPSETAANPPIEKPSTKKAPEISKQQFSNMLIEVGNGTKKAGNFSEYLCGNTSIPVVADGEVYTFSSFCNKLNDKIIRINGLSFTKDDNNCIQNINVDYEVKKILGWGKDKD